MSCSDFRGSVGEEVQVKKYLDAAFECAKSAGDLQMARLHSEHSIDFKGETDLVTEVDRECEKLIVDRLRNEFPGCGILAEEASYGTGGHDMRWIIDPVDGTNNYAHGYPWFCVSIALEIEGEVGLGVIFHPPLDEIFTAVRGEGAFLNGRRLKVSGSGLLRNSLLATGFPYDKAVDNENNFQEFVNFQLRTRGVRRAGSAALDLASVAAGRLDGYWECKIKPWDVSAGMLLVEEAGGCVTGYKGEAYSPYHHRIAASNGFIHSEMLEVLALTGKTREAG
jgi:myo-inositol-1(or 4)-monophosphatase